MSRRPRSGVGPVPNSQTEQRDVISICGTRLESYILRAGGFPVVGWPYSFGHLHSRFEVCLLLRRSHRLDENQ